jgi:hypothetical protein
MQPFGSCRITGDMGQLLRRPRRPRRRSCGVPRSWDRSTTLRCSLHGFCGTRTQRRPRHQAAAPPFRLRPRPCPTRAREHRPRTTMTPRTVGVAACKLWPAPTRREYEPSIHHPRSPQCRHVISTSETDAIPRRLSCIRRTAWAEQNISPCVCVVFDSTVSIAQISRVRVMLLVLY